MNWKHFLRGLGAGVIFSALIMLVAYMTTGSYRISDEEVIARAEKLGMVMEEKSIIASDTDSDTDSNSELNTESASETSAQNTESNTEAKAEATTEKSKDATTTEEEINTKYTTADITVTSGMGSEDIAKLVQDAGIIDDYKDFDDYLNQNGYSQNLSVNTFHLNSGMSYEEIAKELTKGDQ